MDCSHVREHLSDYIDEGLEAKTKALVEEHLSECKDCQQEVASLRMLIKDLGCMETVAPPKDFLDQLHRRIERRFRFSKIVDMLSFPLRAKLPMKFAGAAVMAILVFTIIQIQRDQHSTRIIPPMQEPIRSESFPPKMAKAPLERSVQEEAFSSGALREKAKSKPQAMQVIVEETKTKRLPDNGVNKIAHVETRADHPSRKEASTGLTLAKTASSVQESIQSESSPLKTAKAPSESGMQEEADSTGVVWERARPKSQTGMQTILQKDEAKSLSDNAVRRTTHTETKADHPSQKGDLIELSLVIERERQPDIIRAASDMEAPQAQETKVRRRLTMGEPVPTTQLEREKRETSIEQLLPRLSEVTERAGGEVVSVEYEEETHIPESMRVEIPAEQIGIFQNDLQTLGTLHGAPIVPTGEDNEILPIRIRLLTP